MEIFNKTNDPKYINISGSQLYKILKFLAEYAKIDIKSNMYNYFVKELSIEYNNTTHFTGIRYQKVPKPQIGFTKEFEEELMKVEFDNELYNNVDELYSNVVLEGQKLSDINEGIYVDKDFADVLKI